MAEQYIFKITGGEEYPSLVLNKALVLTAEEEKDVTNQEEPAKYEAGNSESFFYLLIVIGVVCISYAYKKKKVK